MKSVQENINPLSGRGGISFTTFLWSVAGAVVFNLVVYAVIRSLLIASRSALDKDRTILLYGVWFVFAMIGFGVISNTFIKRWNVILGERAISGGLRAVIRFSLLSPVLSFAMTGITILFFARKMGDDVDRSTRSWSRGLLFGSLVASLGATYFISNSALGLDRFEMRNSIRPYVEAAGYDENPFPASVMVRPFYAVATPAARYLAWLASDAARTKILSLAIERDAPQQCRERLGYLSVEVRDCYFSQLRKLAGEAPMVSPYFALYFESQYRKKVAETVQGELNSDLFLAFAYNLLVISNQLELVEPGPMFVERVQFLKPSLLLHAFGSPEIPLVEAGQDAQRIMMIEKLMGAFEMEMKAVREQFEKHRHDLAVNESIVGNQLRDLQIRIDKIKRDPLLIAVARK